MTYYEILNFLQHIAREIKVMRPRETLTDRLLRVENQLNTMIDAIQRNSYPRFSIARRTTIQSNGLPLLEMLRVEHIDEDAEGYVIEVS